MEVMQNLMRGITMNQSEVFGTAIWVKTKELDICPVIRTNFEIDCEVKKATLKILGLGTYVFYVNGNEYDAETFKITQFPQSCAIDAVLIQ